jgi:hypothetical protein
MTVRKTNQGKVRERSTQVDEDEDVLEFEGAESKSPSLIRTFGEFWDPELVRLTGRRLMGRKEKSRKDKSINVYEERGVYVLYKDFEPVYVGKADGESIGSRIQKHRKSQRKGPRWNQFSWFGIRGLRKNGGLLALNNAFHPTKDQLIATLEALLIATIDPRLNARKEKFKNAVRLAQSDEDKTQDVEDRLQSIEEKLQEFLDSRGSQ